MCGRYALSGEKISEKMNALIEMCNQNASSDDRIALKPSCEISPGDNAPGLIFENAVCPVSMRWGFTGKGPRPIINARSEDLADRPMFSHLADKNRCVLPASGYFEWRRGDGQKYLISPESGDTLYLAGLYRRDERDRLHFVVLTRQAFGIHARIHTRMPVTIRSREEARRWLRGELSIENLTGKEDASLQANVLGPEQMTMSFIDQPDADE